MRSENTFGIHFILRINKMKNGKAPLRVRITVNTSRCEGSLKTLVEVSEWNASKGLAKPKSEKAKSLNSFLEQVRGQLADCYQQLQLQRKSINAEGGKNLFLGNERKEHTLCSLIEYHNVSMRNTLAHGTIKNCRDKIFSWSPHNLSYWLYFIMVSLFYLQTTIQFQVGIVKHCYYHN